MAQSSAEDRRVESGFLVLDGPLAPVACAAVTPTEKCTCPDPHTCAIRLVMTEVRRDLTALLDQRSIDDLLRLAPSPGALAFEI